MTSAATTPSRAQPLSMATVRCERTSTGTAMTKKNGIRKKAGRTSVVALNSAPASAKSRSLPECAARRQITIAAVAMNAVHNSVTIRPLKYASGEYRAVIAAPMIAARSPAARRTSRNTRPQMPA